MTHLKKSGRVLALVLWAHSASAGLSPEVASPRQCGYVTEPVLVRLERHAHNDPQYSDLDLEPEKAMCRYLRLNLFKVNVAPCGDVSLCFPQLTCNVPVNGEVVRQSANIACKRDQSDRGPLLGCPETADDCIEDRSISIKKTTLKNLKKAPKDKKQK